MQETQHCDLALLAAPNEGGSAMSGAALGVIIRRSGSPLQQMYSLGYDADPPSGGSSGIVTSILEGESGPHIDSLVS